jgi:NADPH-dependent curcumin reductase CurA
MKPEKLDATARKVGLSELPEAFAALLGGAGKGRTVVSLA